MIILIIEIPVIVGVGARVFFVPTEARPVRDHPHGRGRRPPDYPVSRFPAQRMQPLTTAVIKGRRDRHDLFDRSPFSPIHASSMHTPLLSHLHIAHKIP
jgi:hypothetical protein